MLDFYRMDIVRTAKALGIRFNPKYSTKTDYRSGKHGSLSIKPDQNVFYCHETLQGGTCLDLIQHKIGCNKWQSIQWYQEHIGEIPETISSTKKAHKTPRKKKPDRESGTFEYAQKIWSEPTLKNIFNHPYFTEKKLDYHFGIKRGLVSGCVIGSNSDCLIIPLFHKITGALNGIQAINNGGEKQTFGNLKDSWFLLHGSAPPTTDDYETALIVEGYATGSTICSLMKFEYLVCISFGKNQLESCALTLQRRGFDTIIFDEDDKK